MARNSNIRKSGRKTVSILVDGETEKWYLDMFRRYEIIQGVTIKPDLPQKKKLSEQYEMVKSNAEMYDLSIWIVDLDVIIKDELLKELERYMLDAHAIRNIHILVNAPCLEFWFLQHVSDTGRFYNNYNGLIPDLKKLDPLKRYEKTEKYFVKDHPDIYKRLRPHLKNAIANGMKRGAFDIRNPKTAKAEMYKLFELLGLTITD